MFTFGKIEGKYKGKKIKRNNRWKEKFRKIQNFKFFIRQPKYRKPIFPKAMFGKRKCEGNAKEENNGNR